LRNPSVVLRPHGEDPQKILEAYLEYMQLPPFEELERTNHLWAPRIIGFLRDIHRYAKASHRGGSVKELISNLVYSGK
jgi:hypothetical protein